jgi:hypothetical protein
MNRWCETSVRRLEPIGSLEMSRDVSRVVANIRAIPSVPLKRGRRR